MYAFEIFAGSGVSAPTDTKIKQPFHALDYNDMELIAHQAMPSIKYVDLPLGASATNYVAPADGYFTVAKQAGGSNEYLSMINNSNKVATAVYMPNGYNGRVYMPASKGDVITVTYSASGTTQYFYFVYANGAK